MNINKIKQFLIQLVKNKPLAYFIELRHKYKDIYNFLIDKYKGILDGQPLSVYVYWFIHDITKHPKCNNPNCNNNTMFLSINKGYMMYCSRLCMQTDPLTEQKRQQTNLKLYGFKHAQQSSVIKDKVKKQRDEKIKNDPNYLIQFGNSIRNGFKEKEKENPNYWFDREQKTKATKIANGRDPNWNNRDKFRKTIQSFSNEKKQEISNKRTASRQQHINQIVKKMKSTIVKHKSEDSNYTKKILNKRYITKQKKYGDPYSRNSKKAKETCLKLYGVESYTQTHEYHSKRLKSYYSKEYNCNFDSKWEYIVYDFCKKHNITVIYQPNISFKYSYHGKIHKYNPDFLINNKLYEVKGDHFFNVDGTMRCPYKLKTWSNAKYIEQCELYEAKHQCMISNGVIILKSNDIKKLEKILL